MARPRPEKASSATIKVLPMDLRVRDRLTDETAEWELIGRPFTLAASKNADVRVQRVGQPGVTDIRTWARTSA